ncbi:hypothetical protein MES5069_270048 [Mesorhizobium escarrei]|uniref:Uncharacterized protein n=1 Tax=Mesorhizobium escarrei TaxID=666018 RepID=A0ABM9DVS4_9HYPH|nr:hypothetical protein MES5069_270048 [Mesorhizobium escarrei]
MEMCSLRLDCQHLTVYTSGCSVNFDASGRVWRPSIGMRQLNERLGTGGVHERIFCHCGRLGGRHCRVRAAGNGAGLSEGHGDAGYALQRRRR